jgi:hypothetical protein
VVARVPSEIQPPASASRATRSSVASEASSLDWDLASLLED